jgi:CO/xanthine dehydrogenase Mo-binding subunit
MFDVARGRSAISEATETRARGISRRRFMGYLIAAPTVVAGAQLMVEPAQAAIPTHQPVDDYDLTDLLTDATLPTSGLITVTVNPDGSASFALPRAEVGQGITTAVAMTIADEMDLPLDKVNVTLADARPELVWNQLTGGSNSMHSIFTPVRVAAATARGQLLQAAAALLGGLPSDLSIATRDQLRGGKRPGRQSRDLGEPEVADLGPGADRDEPRTRARERQGPRHAGWRLVRAPSVRRQRVRSSRDLAKAR